MLPVTDVLMSQTRVNSMPPGTPERLKTPGTVLLGSESRLDKCTMYRSISIEYHSIDVVRLVGILIGQRWHQTDYVTFLSPCNTGTLLHRTVLYTLHGTPVGSWGHTQGTARGTFNALQVPSGSSAPSTPPQPGTGPLTADRWHGQ